MASDLRVTTSDSHGFTIISVSGEIDVGSAPLLREEVLRTIAAGNIVLIVDLQGVQFIDSSGLGVLVGALKRVQTHDGDLRLVCSRQEVLKPLRVTGLTRVFAIFETLADACAMAPPAP